MEKRKVGRPAIPKSKKAKAYVISLLPDEAAQLRMRFGTLTKAARSLLKPDV